MRANWTRGLFRLWGVLTVLWLAGSIYFAITDRSIPSLARGCEELRSFVEDKSNRPLGDAEVTQCNEVWTTKRMRLVEQLMGPPLGTLALGIVLAWVIRGFRLKDP
jgi:hypothetical protein